MRKLSVGMLGYGSQAQSEKNQASLPFERFQSAVAREFPE
jgi:hypothetical protein